MAKSFKTLFSNTFQVITLNLESLEKYIEEHKEKKTHIQVNKIKSIISQLLEGLKYAHSKGNKQLTQTSYIETSNQRMYYSLKMK
jgi:serine/threonine protein kinase